MVYLLLCILSVVMSRTEGCSCVFLLFLSSFSRKTFRLSVVDGEFRPDKLQMALHLMNFNLLEIYRAKEGTLPPPELWGKLRSSFHIQCPPTFVSSDE